MENFIFSLLQDNLNNNNNSTHYENAINNIIKYY